MKVIRILAAVILVILLTGTASAYTVPAEYRTGSHMNDVEVWKVSEEHIGDKWAQDNMRQMGQTYTNKGISGFASVGDFVKQKGVAELRAKMTYYAGRTGITPPILLIGT